MAVATAVFMAAGSGLAAAQAPLAVSDASAFLGAWTLGLETPQGAATLELTLKDDAGKVAGTISMPDLAPTPAPLTSIAKKGDSLVVSYTLDMQGQGIPVTISIAPAGDKWKANFDFADGQFAVDGTAMKK
jgi:hypothetical protein